MVALLERHVPELEGASIGFYWKETGGKDGYVSFELDPCRPGLFRIERPIRPKPLMATRTVVSVCLRSVFG